MIAQRSLQIVEILKVVLGLKEELLLLAPWQLDNHLPPGEEGGGVSSYYQIPAALTKHLSCLAIN